MDAIAGTGIGDQIEAGESWPEEEYIPLSALEHFSYCPRQCALIHLDQVFDENVFTLRGQAVHEKVDVPGTEETEGMRVERALPLWSRRYGLTGKADIVEFRDGLAYPVEYKQGPRRKKGHDELQLCGQALCLEEMTGHPVPKGAIYHFSSRRRREVTFTNALQEKTVLVAQRVRAMLGEKTLPAPVNDARCPNCSLVAACVPKVSDRRRQRVLLCELFKPEES